MRLYEHEGKALLSSSQIPVPQGTLLASDTPFSPSFPCILKAQVLHGNRALQGLVQKVTDQDSYLKARKHLFTAGEHILVEVLVSYTTQVYCAFRYDTVRRCCIMQWSYSGGTGIESRSETLQTVVCPVDQETPFVVPDCPVPTAVLASLRQCFLANDCTLLEVNPLVKTESGEWMALDAKVELDDAAVFRHPEWDSYPARTLFSRQPTAMEQEAKAINALDHRGVAGASFFEFSGTIGVLVSGGGASQVAMDGLLASGLAPANYTEYSGNPSRDKVRALAALVLSKPGLEALWVIGGNANFTDIYETLQGVMDAIVAAALPAGFPVIIRRGGPRWEEAFAALKDRASETKASIQMFGPDFPMLATTGVLIEAVAAYRQGKSL